MGSGAKSYMRKGFLIYEEMCKFFPIYEKALVIYDFAPDPLNFLIYEENLIFFFISVCILFEDVCFQPPTGGVFSMKDYFSYRNANSSGVMEAEVFTSLPDISTVSIIFFRSMFAYISNLSTQS
jgi:hypothetical protein